MPNNESYGVNKDEVDFWVNNRHTVDSLYPSEKKFLIPSITASKSTLDVGCAAGGGYHFCKEINPDIKYTGIDISQNLLDAAKKNSNSDANFIHYDGHKIDFDETFDTVYCLGVLHHLHHWRELAKEMYDSSNKYTFFDVRGTHSKTLDDKDKSFQKIALGGVWDQETTVPYIINNIQELRDSLTKMVDINTSIKIYGYSGPPSHLAVTSYDEVLMLGILLTKDDPSASEKLEMTLE